MAREVTCKRCEEKRPHYARGECKRCYEYRRRHGKPRPLELTAITGKQVMQAYVMLTRNEMSVHKIAQALKVDGKTVKRALLCEGPYKHLRGCFDHKLVEIMLAYHRAAGCKSLNPVQVQEIIRKHANGRSQRSLAREYEVSKGTIWNVVNRNAWTWVKV